MIRAVLAAIILKWQENMTLASVQHATTLSPIIYGMGVMNQQLIHRSLNLGLVAEAKQLQRIDRHLIWLLHIVF
jgi:hypothetical protein